MSQRDLTNILSGPCSLTAGGVDLGHTFGETRLAVTPRFREHLADGWGQTPVDLIHVGTDVRVTARVAEWTLAGLEKLYPLGVTGSGYLGVGRAPGARLRDEAETLVLHPLALGADTSRDVTFWLAAAADVVSVGFSNDDDCLFDVTFRILPDPTQSAGEELGRIGAGA